MIQPMEMPDAPLRRVLVADDERHIVRIVQIALERAGTYEVFEATHGREALEMALEDPEGFDVILLDHTMPEMSGADVVRELRQTARYADAPIYVITAGAQDRIRGEALAAGATGFLTKPFSPLGLQVMLDNLFSEGAAGAT